MPALLTRLDDRLQLLREVYEQNIELGKQDKPSVKPISLTKIERQMKAAVRETYNDAFTLGKRAAGNLLGINPADESAIKHTRIDEYRYMRGFLSDMRDGGGVMSYEKRMTYYAMAARELYWLGWVLADLSKSRKISWKMVPEAEHCADCLRFAKHGPYSADSFWSDVASYGYLPQSGRLACLGINCPCRLVES